MHPEVWVDEFTRAPEPPNSEPGPDIQQMHSLLDRGLHLLRLFRCVDDRLCYRSLRVESPGLVHYSDCLGNCLPRHLSLLSILGMKSAAVAPAEDSPPHIFDALVPRSFVASAAEAIEPEGRSPKDAPCFGAVRRCEAFDRLVVLTHLSPLVCQSLC